MGCPRDVPRGIYIFGSVWGMTGEEMTIHMTEEREREIREQTLGLLFEDQDPELQKLRQMINELLGEKARLEERWKTLPDGCPHEDACRDSAIENYEPEPPDEL